MMYPSYLNLSKGEFERRIDEAYGMLDGCFVCPRECGVNRLDDERSECNVGVRPMISSYSPHFGEEPPITGINGSGTIFFTYCNLHCRFCQNYDISQAGSGREVDTETLARIMLDLQDNRCHNINFVSPSHQVPQILKSLMHAIQGGLKVPIVYNTNGYDSVNTLKLLDGVVDIYMPDLKYSDDRMGEAYSDVKDYAVVCRRAIREMYRQVGDLKLDERGVAIRGLLIRHLVMPNEIAGTEDGMKYIAEEISRDTYINLMSQYRPAYKAYGIKELSRRITHEEYARAASYKDKYGLKKGWLQG